MRLTNTNVAIERESIDDRGEYALGNGFRLLKGEHVDQVKYDSEPLVVSRFYDDLLYRWM